MKKLFSRDKAKGRPAPSDIGSGVPTDYPLPHSYAQRHDRSQSLTPYSSDEHWSLIDSDAHSYTARSTLSVPHTPPIPSSGPPSAVRAASPVSSNHHTVVPHPPPKHAHRDPQPQLLRKKPNGVSASAALGILRALDPHVEPPNQPDVSDDGMTEHSFREEKREKEKEKRGFWVPREKDKERPRDKDHDSQADLTRVIGYLTATSSEDWSLVLEVCERASASDANAKEAAKALKREFKYAEPSAQLSAARLWAIMLRNSSDKFIWQCASRKFLDNLDEVINSPRTSPVVRERLLEVLAAAAYACGSDGKEVAFRTLWRKVKPADKPDEGVPFDTGDAMFYPPTPKHPPPAPDHPLVAPTQRPPVTATTIKPKTSYHTRVIPPDEDMRRLFQECKVGRGNASLLSESLTFAKPEDLKQKDIIKEFYARCRASQELVSAQIPWAFAGAERSRQAAGRGVTASPIATRPSVDSSHTRADSQVSHTALERGELTQEEQLLAALLAANEDLMEALRQYDDLERVGMEREAEERSRKETRLDRTQLRPGDLHVPFLDTGYPSQGGASSSRSPSPSPSSPSLSSAPSFVVHSVPLHPPHPLPPIPLHPAPNVTHASHTITAQPSTQSLAPPPHAPLGPRSRSQGMPRSRTPSPERMSINNHHMLSRGSFESSRNGNALAQDMNRLRVHHDAEVGTVQEEVETPTRPSAKALGKRRVIENAEPDPFDADDTYYDHSDETPRMADDAFESDSDDGRHRSRPQPVHYVYDAAAERTQQRIREGRLAAAALVGSVH
ncbi:uncharacterized protein FIBRA_04200 [Fibroporia radiculosa]|uniref:VHS domain-containing protein n=1 Tax=Fibroporia radiculosa TaxID=599839 RepID=J4G700_9APHY|nr:uncharacterized protein FIBRA_04200 [Fibroporia radiculosa]CCM02123.1 predicted protein [Fibroporia radiculosa]